MSNEYNNPWVYEGRIFTSDDIDDNIAFVYLITDLETNIKYIGKKQLYFVKYRQINKKRKRYKAESDWKTYYSSSKIINELVKKYGENRFKREILKLCKDKSTASYYEAKWLFQNDAILLDTFYNDSIMVRVRSSNLKK